LDGPWQIVPIILPVLASVMAPDANVPGAHPFGKFRTQTYAVVRIATATSAIIHRFIQAHFWSGAQTIWRR